MTISITTPYHYAQCHYAECRILLIVKLHVLMLSVIVLNVTMLSVIVLNVTMLSVMTPFLVRHLKSFSL